MRLGSLMVAHQSRDHKVTDSTLAWFTAR